MRYTIWSSYWITSNDDRCWSSFILIRARLPISSLARRHVFLNLPAEIILFDKGWLTQKWYEWWCWYHYIWSYYSDSIWSWSQLTLILWIIIQSNDGIENPSLSPSIDFRLKFEWTKIFLSLINILLIYSIDIIYLILYYIDIIYYIMIYIKI